eukprot:8172961-Lingulodinium_polyedra.AAC.1
MTVPGREYHCFHQSVRCPASRGSSGQISVAAAPSRQQFHHGSPIGAARPLSRDAAARSPLLA